MFSCLQGLLSKFLVRVRADDDQLDVFICQEIIRCSVMLGVGEVDRTVAPLLGLGRVGSAL